MKEGHGVFIPDERLGKGYRINVYAYGTLWSCWGERLLLRMGAWHRNPAAWACPRFAHFDALEFG